MKNYERIKSMNIKELGCFLAWVHWMGMNGYELPYDEDELNDNLRRSLNNHEGNCHDGEPESYTDWLKKEEES